MPNSLMLWTGGKDSALALHESLRAGHDIRALITFAPPNPTFLAHPLPILALQAAALRIPHHIVTITPPYDSSYERALADLQSRLHIDTLVTGDIDRVCGQANYISERARPLGLHVHMPLWQRDRLAIMQNLVEQHFHIIFSAVQTAFLPPAWLARRLTTEALAELHQIRGKNNLDLAGENGEFHTLTLHSPDFAHAIQLPPHTSAATGTLAHLLFAPSPAPR